MKTNNKPATAILNKDELKELLTETKETLLSGNQLKMQNGKFSIVDLWNMQKKHKTIGSSTRW